MPVKPPTLDELWRIAQDYYMDPSPADLESFLGLIKPMLESYRRLDQLSEPGIAEGLPRTSGHRPGRRSPPQAHARR